MIVANSRSTSKNSQVWRRRKCLKCGGVFTTYEKIIPSYLVVVKKSGKHQKFSRAKLYSSVYHSFLDRKNVDRGTIGEIAEKITNQIERDIIILKKEDIKTVEITQMVLSILRKKAPDSFLRFLAYREGNDKKRDELLKKFF